MKSWRIDRRRLLAGAGAIFTLPLLESFVSRTAWANGAPNDPRRFVAMYMPSGTYNTVKDPVWYPAAGPLTRNLPLVLSPFADHIADFSVLMRLNCAIAEVARTRAPDGGGHLGYSTTWLSQAALADFNSTQCTVPGSSFDQMIADATKTSVLCLTGGCHNVDRPDGSTFGYANYVSFKNGNVNEPYSNPIQLYNLMFANLASTGSGGPPPSWAAARNRSILDASLASIKELQSKLGRSDARKLDDHFASIRALEARLYGTSPPVTPGCTPGTAPGPSLDVSDTFGTHSDTYNARVQAFMDMIVLAFKCDLVRSVSFMYDGEQNGRISTPCDANLLYNNAPLGGTIQHNGIAHYNSSATSDIGKAKAVSRDRNYLSLFFYLLDRLKQATDPSGSPILDNTIVFAGYNIPDGTHVTRNSAGRPLVLGGGKNFMHPGNCVDLGSADFIDLYYTFSTFLKLGWSDYKGSTKVLNI
jgi:hypothetical protein